MKNFYHGQICIGPNMPYFQYPFKFIKLTVDFEIICPNCGPDKGKIKKNSHDKKMKYQPQIFYCQECRSSFFAHTSWIFSRFTDEIVLKVLKDLFIDHLSPKSMAKSLNVSPSFITKIRYTLFDVLKKKIDIIQSDANYLKNFENLPLIRQSGIWWDETYFKNNKTYYCLILIINTLGQVIGYKFSKSRKLEDYMEILNPIKGILPEKPIFICDGNPTYESVVKKVKVETFLIQHIHSQPWKNAMLYYFIPSNTNDSIEQITIKLPYNSFLSSRQRIQFNS